MTRPDERPLRRLPQLEGRKATLERCVFCPKLCRSACPVSNAEPRETLTPWGKMSMAYFVANESVAPSASFAAPAWACTGCFGCREHCDHHNDVAGTLFDARSALVASTPEDAPPGARRVLEQAEGRAKALSAFARRDDASVQALVDPGSPVAVLVGCKAARAASEHGDVAAADAIRATALLVRSKVAVVDTCCGAPLLYAGDRERFARQGERFAEAVRGRETVVVADAGCAAALRIHHRPAGHDEGARGAARQAGGRATGARVVHLAELAAPELARLRRVPELGDGPVRWHDPCQLGRGLGVYDAPRNILARALGRAPDEFERRREDARCSGAGGLLPVTMPDVSRAIGRERVADHERSGGGLVVTACASSRRAFERAGARAIDLATVLVQALAAEPEP